MTIRLVMTNWVDFQLVFNRIKVLSARRAVVNIMKLRYAPLSKKELNILKKKKKKKASTFTGQSLIVKLPMKQQEKN